MIGNHVCFGIESVHLVYEQQIFYTPHIRRCPENDLVQIPNQFSATLSDDIQYMLVSVANST